ncbi:MAG: class I SAM-dependent rRNA methyltransferase [Planctomycetota bacterium]
MIQPQVFPAPPFPAHALLDAGGGWKLERFGDVTLARPDPQALWRPRLPRADWERADLTFERESDRGGVWRPRSGLPKRLAGADAGWSVAFGAGTFLVRPTPFKHVGLFPEQATNWQLVGQAVRELKGALDEPPRVLNLFGYTGAASVLAALEGAAVTHVDASRASITWTSENADASGLGRSALRVICDDALAFAAREVRRGSTYHVILLDPPHYGRGPKGEVWRFEEGFAPLVAAASQLLADRALLVLSTYAIGYSPLALVNVLAELPGGAVEAGELALCEEPRAGLPSRMLPAGFCARWSRGLEAGAVGRRAGAAPSTPCALGDGLA